jgi:hypothetical protein
MSLLKRADHTAAPASLALSVLIWVLVSGHPARGDVFHLKGGGKLEGEVLEELGDAYRVRAPDGIHLVHKGDILKIEKAPSPWEQYEKKRKRCSNTADGHYQLAEWCEKHGLIEERVEHLKQVLQLNPDHVAARRALGFVKKDGAWVKQQATTAPSREELEEQQRAGKEDKIVRKLISKWFVKVNGIYRGGLASGDGRSKTFRRGREQILAIRDPLALPALTGVLSAGNTAARRVLVESLSQFDGDEATMNLLVVILLDPSAEIRKLAALELARRGDPRVVERLREALGSDEEFILRNAAAALGILKARVAVESLVSVLSAETQQEVLVSLPVMLDRIYLVFVSPVRCHAGNRFLLYVPNGIGVLGPNTMIGTETGYEVHTVSVYRTEVQEALIAITGQNFGFDAQAWLKWWRTQPTQTQPSS